MTFRRECAFVKANLETTSEWPTNSLSALAVIGAKLGELQRELRNLQPPKGETDAKRAFKMREFIDNVLARASQFDGDFDFLQERVS